MLQFRLRFFAISLLFVICSLLNPLATMAQKEKKTVLYLNSYHDGYQWSDNVLEGIRNVLTESEYMIDLQIEYMDVKKYNYDIIKTTLYTLYKEKFKYEIFDVVLVSDNDALSFVHEYRDELFPDVPIVFCGVNGIETVDLAMGNITGVIENFDLAGTLDIARELHPHKKRMIVFGDDSITGHAIAKQVENKMLLSDPDLHVEFWFSLSVEETVKRVENLPDDTFLFFTPWYQTVNGRFFTTEEVMEEIYAHSKVPLYTSWDFLLGHGVVGGSMLSGAKHGSTAAQIALQVLHGQEAETIPIMIEEAGSYMFDYNVMTRLDIDQSLLPEGATIINSPKIFYELSKELFWTIMISFFLLFTALLFLLIAMSERRKMERQALEQLSFLETLMDSIPQLVSWKDLQGKYLGANRTFIEFFGIDSIESMRDKTAKDVVSDKDYGNWSTQADAAVIKERRPFRKMRRHLIDHSGTSGWLEVNKVPLLDQAGKIVGILSTAENITKEQNLEKQLIQSQKMEAIGTLAGGIAHDFNNILTSIINSTELAMGDVEPGSQTEKDLQRVLRAARRGSRVVKQILSFSRPSSEGFQPTDIAQIIHEVLGLLDASLPANIAVNLEIDSEKMMVNSDPTQIHQVILNLCTNAFHALREVGGTLGIGLSTVCLDIEQAVTMNITDGEYVKMTISDSGHGIDSEIIDNIFDPFFSTKDITEGTGLGLAVVHGIIKGHKGAIKVHSAPGEGTCFEIYLPKSQDNDFPADADTITIDQGNLTILFVEDDEDQLNSVPRILREMGHTVIAIQDPIIAIEQAQLQKDAIDVIISDYDMPAMNGTQLAKTLEDFPIILVSGREDAIIAAKKQPNIIKTIIKPYDKQDLKVALGAKYDKE
ncbi:ABC transporter substrate binding protein [Desulfosediminicola ganghwensis]|uniref:hybrid sensor histidine kinase/response regulator n=1 Tax=Desulfosediminicola ganghwensis TaxID=2569540 RepID=UPI0010AC6059|nr:ABC transporter substrate binding protein [Desulfosediminicola ganghwensis]